MKIHNNLIIDVTNASFKDKKKLDERIYEYTGKRLPSTALISNKPTYFLIRKTNNDSTDRVGYLYKDEKPELDKFIQESGFYTSDFKKNYKIVSYKDILNKKVISKL